MICQFSPHQTRETLAAYVPQRDVYPAGRLDADSEGLVVLTADGALQHTISNPRRKLPKVYYAQVEGIAGAHALERLRRGVMLADGSTRPATAEEVAEPTWIWPRTPPIRVRRAIPTSWIRLTLTEGRNRQVRRMTAAVGLPTLRLIRHSVGPWTLESLAPGEWRETEVAGEKRYARHRSHANRSTAGRAQR